MTLDSKVSSPLGLTEEVRFEVNFEGWTGYYQMKKRKKCISGYRNT